MRINSSASAAVSVSRSNTTASADFKSTVSAVSTDAKGIRADDRGGCLPHPMPPFPPVKPGADTTSRTQGRQLYDIADGLRDGSITAQESERLLKQQEAIAQAQQRAMADGKLTPQEARELKRMQVQAQRDIDNAVNNRQRDSFVDGNAQRQADQLDRIANGRRNGNVTTSEASELLHQQVGIADARGDADSFEESLALGGKLNAADKDITYHSRPGTQHHFRPLPFPHPLPEPLPFPKPFPRPLPDFDPVLLRSGAING